MNLGWPKCVAALAAVATILMALYLLTFGPVRTYPPELEEFTPVEFQESVDSKFFFSIGDELKYSDSLDPQSKTLLQGKLKLVVPSPDNKLAAVVLDDRLVVVSGAGSYVHEVARVDSIFEEPKPIGTAFVRDGEYQWSLDSQSLYLIKDEFYELDRAQLFSAKGELWRFDVNEKVMSPVLVPFQASSLFLGTSGRIFFSIPDEHGNLVLHAYDGVEVTNLEVLNYEVADLGKLSPESSEKYFYSFSFSEYQAYILATKGVSLQQENKIETLSVNGIEILRSSEGQMFKGPFYASEMFRSVFLPGDRYLLLNIHSGAFQGQLLVDSSVGAYKTLPANTLAYPTMNTAVYDNYKVVGMGIELVGERVK